MTVSLMPMEEGQLAFGRTKDQLLQSAVRLFFEQGYNQTSIQQVVDSAKLTKGAFYHYFSSKEDVLHYIHDSYLDVELRRAEEAVSRELTAAETLRALIEAMLDTVVTYRDRVTILARERTSLSGTHKAVVREKRDKFAEIVTSVVARGVATNEFRPVEDPQLVAFAVIGMCAWSLEWLKSDGTKTVSEIAALFSDLILKGLEYQEKSDSDQ